MKPDPVSPYCSPPGPPPQGVSEDIRASQAAWRAAWPKIRFETSPAYLTRTGALQEGELDGADFPADGHPHELRKLEMSLNVTPFVERFR